MKNIVLVGSPGAEAGGLGRALAQRLGLVFSTYDSSVAKNPPVGGSVIAGGDDGVLQPDDLDVLRDNAVLVVLDTETNSPYEDVSFDVRLPGGSLDKLVSWLAQQSNPLGAAYLVVGGQVLNSMAPRIHNSILRELGQSPAVALAEVHKGELETWLAYARQNLQGFSLNSPHKMEILPFIDELSEEAQMCGSVNTVRVDEGRLVGFNTDIWGITRTLRYLQRDFAGRNVAVLGSGSMAKAAALGACVGGAPSVTVYAQDAEAAKILVQGLWNQLGSYNVYWDELRPAMFRESPPDVLINATLLGMKGGEEFEDLGFIDDMPQNAIVMDLVYEPRQTMMLNKAKGLGMAMINGIGVQMFQAIKTNNILFSQNHGIDIVRKVLAVIAKE